VEQRLSARGLLAGATGAVYLVPFVKYPPNPPAVGQADTIGAHTGWYLASVVLAVAAAGPDRWPAARLGAWHGRLLGVRAQGGRGPSIPT
jgi:hypothetical protein